MKGGVSSPENCEGVACFWMHSTLSLSNFCDLSQKNDWLHSILFGGAAYR